jgi:hypothetical protein
MHRRALTACAVLSLLGTAAASPKPDTADQAVQKIAA